MFERFKFWKSDIISFYCHPNLEDIIPKPRPASKYFPDWFKNLPSYYEIEQQENQPPHAMFEQMTAKRCIPLIDGMSVGYTIPLCGDVYVKTNKDNSEIIATPLPTAQIPLIEFHPKEQLGGPNKVTKNSGDAIKFINPWIIKTAPGWSTLFIPPANHFDQPFTCLSALVDTDKYPKEVNFPAIWNLPNARVTLKSGTPLITAIPIKRSSISKKVNIRKMTKKEFNLIEKMTKIQSLKNHYYTQDLRVKK